MHWLLMLLLFFVFCVIFSGYVHNLQPELLQNKIAKVLVDVGDFILGLVGYNIKFEKTSFVTGAN